MNGKITVIVGGKTFTSDNFDNFVKFIEDKIAIHNNLIDADFANECKKAVEETAEYLGKIAKLDIENLKVENMAVLALPEKYGQTLLDEQKEFEKNNEDEEEDFLDFLRMMGAPLPYKSSHPELADELAKLEFTIIDTFPNGDGSSNFKVIRNDNTDIIFWMSGEAFLPILNHDVLDIRD